MIRMFCKNEYFSVEQLNETESDSNVNARSLRYGSPLAVQTSTNDLLSVGHSAQQRRHQHSIKGIKPQPNSIFYEMLGS